MNVTIDNFIGIFEGAYPKEYCDTVIDYFHKAADAGMVISRQQQEAHIAKLDKDDMQWFGHDEVSMHYSRAILPNFNSVFWDTIYPVYASKFDVLKTYEPHTNYAFKVQKTEIGGGYHMWHSENNTRRSSGRILVWTLYLNNVEEGGETEFLYYPKRIKPKAGTLVLWPAGFTHTHRGNPPLSNTKYIVTGWVEF